MAYCCFIIPHLYVTSTWSRTIVKTEVFVFTYHSVVWKQNCSYKSPKEGFAHFSYLKCMKSVNSQVNTDRACPSESRGWRLSLPNRTTYANVVWMQFSCMLSSMAISRVKDFKMFAAWKSQRQMFDLQMCVPK